MASDDNYQTNASALATLTQAFANAGTPTPGLDARILLRHVTRQNAADLISSPNRRLRNTEIAQLQAVQARRLSGEPVSRIQGKREFWGLDIEIGPGVLDPRCDTETLVSGTCKLLERQGRRCESLSIADLGTGSGALLIALLSELPESHGLGVDLSWSALEIARRNAQQHKLERRCHFVQSTWLNGIDDQFDVIVSNPPYIPSTVIPTLRPEVARFDPRLALDGGSDGLTAYRLLAHEFGRTLKPGGFAIVEVGFGQAEIVTKIFSALGFYSIAPTSRLWRDLNGTIRSLAVSHKLDMAKKGVGMNSGSR